MTDKVDKGADAMECDGRTTVTASIALSPAEKQALIEIAKRDGRSVSGQVRYLLREHLAVAEGRTDRRGTGQ